jgi:flagellar biosynthetic protein FliO
MKELLWFLLASGLVIGLAYFASHWLATWQTTQTRGRRLRVIEGVPLGRDRSLLLVAVGREVLVLGSSSHGVTLVHRITDPEAVAELLAQQAPPPESHPAMAAVEASIRSSLERMRTLMAKMGGRSDG